MAGEQMAFLAGIIILIIFILIFTGVGKTIVDFVVNSINIEVLRQKIFP